MAHLKITDASGRQWQFSFSATSRLHDWPRARQRGRA